MGDKYCIYLNLIQTFSSLSKLYPLNWMWKHCENANVSWKQNVKTAYDTVDRTDIVVSKGLIFQLQLLDVSINRTFKPAIRLSYYSWLISWKNLQNCCIIKHSVFLLHSEFRTEFWKVVIPNDLIKWFFSSVASLMQWVEPKIIFE